jgi:hypothetical protein
MRLGGLTVIALVFLSALVRVWAPQTSISGGGKSEAAAPGAGKVEQKQGSTPVNASDLSYPVALKEKIRDFFGEEHSPNSIGGQSTPCPLSANSWCVPSPRVGDVRFILATVPDPIHSHLSLFFDRSIDAIIEGIGTQNYLLDRSLMPWHYFGDPTGDETREQAKVRESYPGLMIFRSESSPPSPPLFVFIIGEAPTSGINQEQFHHALNILRDIRKGVVSPMSKNTPEFGILGPTFSGSLYSLSLILSADRKAAASQYTDRRLTLPAYATVMGTPSIESFAAKAPDYVRMAIFEEDAKTVFDALRTFVKTDLGYEDSHIAVLSEDETAYGGSLDPDHKILSLSFPRGISQFRSEYSSEFQSKNPQQDTGSGNPQDQRNLRLDLEVTGSDDDTVAPYAKSQIPLSQEGVMLGILAELHLRQPKFILLRATDPLDELFLARYLREKYPQGRLVVPTPDLLFPRDEAGQLEGVLGLNTYPLSPAGLNPRCVDFKSPILFPSSSGAALYNAASMLVKRLDSPDLEIPVTKADSSGTGVLPDGPICGLSPNLWLTIVSGNAIHPIKVLGVSRGSTFFPSSGTGGTSESVPIETRIPATWLFPFAFSVAFLFLHAWMSWAGGTMGVWLTPPQLDFAQRPFRRKAAILWFGGVVLATIAIVLLSAIIPGRPESPYDVLFLLPLVLFVLFECWDLGKRRREGVLCILYLVAVGIAAALSMMYASGAQQTLVFWRQRTLDLTSGISPVTPVVLLLASFYAWFWYSFRGESLVEWRYPQLPESGWLPDKYYRLSNSSADGIRERLRTFSEPWWVVGASAITVVLVAIPWMRISPGHVPFRSLEGWSFDVVYSILLALAVLALIATLLRILAVWLKFQSMLTALDRPGFREALQRLSGFEWNVIWNPAWSMEKEGYKLIAREIQTIERLGESLGDPENLDRYEDKLLSHNVGEILKTRTELMKIFRGTAADSTSLPLAVAIMNPFKNILTRFAQTAGLLCTCYLDVSWQHLPAENAKPIHDSEGSETKVNVGTALIRLGPVLEVEEPPKDPCGLSLHSLSLAEEFVGGIYANFLVAVLLRIRGLVFSAVAIYVFIVFSTISYPFQPSPELSTMAIVLFLACGLVIGYVYEEMHRDPTLSRMTSTTPGKLDSAFWTKFVSAGIVPLIALVSTVYPPFGHLLYSMVGPLLQALR